MKKKTGRIWMWIGAITVALIALIAVWMGLPSTDKVEVSRGKSMRFGINDSGYESGKAAYDAGDYATAIEKLQLFAERGETKAQYYLGLSHKKNGNSTKADEWYRKAAEQGHIEAQHILAVAYEDSDPTEAAKWYRMAAEQGRALAQYELGLMYYEGKGVLQDYVEAHKWLNLATSGNHRLARKKRDEVAQRMTADQIAEAQHQAREWFNRE